MVESLDRQFAFDQKTYRIHIPACSPKGVLFCNPVNDIDITVMSVWSEWTQDPLIIEWMHWPLS